MTTHAATPLQTDLTSGWKPQTLSSGDVKYATWIAFFAWVFAVYDFILFGTLLPVMGGHYSWSEAEQAEIATWVAVGGAVVAFAIGPIVDRIGRRGCISWCGAAPDRRAKRGDPAQLVGHSGLQCARDVGDCQRSSSVVRKFAVDSSAVQPGRFYRLPVPWLAG